MQYLQQTKNHILNTIANSNPNYKFFQQHVNEVERWTKWLMQRYSCANQNIVLLSVYLHDIGQMIGSKDIDHAINSETETYRFLNEIGASHDLIEQVAHCVRSHRCRDIQPATLEAKILAAADSASHMSDFCYIVMIELNGKEFALGKLDRDYRDVGLFPELQQELTPLYNCWKNLIKIFPDTKFQENIRNKNGCSDQN